MTAAIGGNGPTPRIVVVTGVGRSGTSFAARVLHEDFDVPMGPPDRLETEPDGDLHEHGSYEDPKIREIHARSRRDPEFRETLDVRIAHALVGRLRDADGPIGVKDPRILDFPGVWAIVAHREPLVVCERDVESVVASWNRVTSSGPEEARRRIEDRQIALPELVDAMNPTDVVRIDFSERRSRDYVRDRLAQIRGVEAE